MSGTKPRWGGAPTEKCVKCQKTVYAAEMTKMENQIWHIECLRCVECNKKLAGANWGGFVPPNNSPYCNIHHKRLLQAAGSAIEFSGSTTDSKWNIRVNIEGAQGSAPPSSSSGGGGEESSSSEAQSSEAVPDSGSGDAETSSTPPPRATSSSGSGSGTPSSSASPSTGGGAKPKWGGAPSEKCVKCGKTVYSAEMAKMENQIWHDNCLRCTEEGCNKKLSGSNWGGFVPPNNSPYCKVHFQRLLQATGSAVGFSGSTTNSKWKINNTT